VLTCIPKLRGQSAVTIARLTRPVALVVSLGLAALATLASATAVSAATAPAAVSAATAPAAPAAAVPAAAVSAATAPAAAPAAPAAAVSAGTPAAAPAVAVSPARHGTRMASYGPNWAGYVATGTRFRYVTATFTVPRADCAKTPGTTKTPAIAADWVGLDGLGGEKSTVEQDGVTVQCVNGVASYFSWWEMYPKTPVYPGVTVYPGDVIEASVWYNAAVRKYRLYLADLTEGTSFTYLERCGASTCRDDSAEVITESPAESVRDTTKLWPFADFGTSTFWRISITDAVGQRGGFDSSLWQSTQLVMVDSSNHVKATTSGLAVGGTAFTTYWKGEK
jgi:hypothetical protein